VTTLPENWVTRSNIPQFFDEWRLLNVRSVPSFPNAARISFSGNKPVVRDGPFSQAKEVVCGHCIIEVKCKEEAIQWADLARSQEERC
jgi:hypothetical protein